MCTFIPTRSPLLPTAGDSDQQHGDSRPGNTCPMHLGGDARGREQPPQDFDASPHGTTTAVGAGRPRTRTGPPVLFPLSHHPCSSSSPALLPQPLSSSCQLSRSVMSDSVTLGTAARQASVHRQLPEFTHTHVHGVRDAIQPSHPLWSSSPPTFNLFQHQCLFK